MIDVLNRAFPPPSDPKERKARSRKIRVGAALALNVLFLVSVTASLALAERTIIQWTLLATALNCWFLISHLRR